MSREVVLRPGNIIDYFMFKLIDPLTYPSGKERGFNDTLKFFNKNIPNPEDFLVFLSQKDFFPLVRLAKNFHKKDERHASGDPYFKHIFYTSYLSYELLKTLKYDKNQARIFIAAALLHDTIEMKRTNHEPISEANLFNQLKQNGVENDGEARKIVALVSFLTPHKKDNSRLTSEEWRAKKRKNFKRIMNAEPSKKLPSELLEMAKHINIADDTAIIREIIFDVSSGNDGPNKVVQNHKSFENRVANYNERIKMIADKYPNHPLLPQLRNDLKKLNQLLPRG